MKRFALLALFLCTSFVFAEADLRVKSEDDSLAEELSFTEEPLELSEEEVVEDEAFLELLKTAVLPELHSLDRQEEEDTTPPHISISFVSDEELEKPQVEAFRKQYLSPSSWQLPRLTSPQLPATCA